MLDHAGNEPENTASTLSIRVLGYCEDGITKDAEVDTDELSAERTDPDVTWVDISGAHDAQDLADLGSRLHLHPLLLQDIANRRHRARVEIDEEQVTIIARRIATSGERATAQLTMILREGMVVTFQDQSSPWVDPIRRRIERSRGLVRKSGADYLTYVLLDAAVDSFVPATEALADELDRLDRQILRRPSRDALTAIHRLRRRLGVLRRHAVNQREAVSVLLRSDTPLVHDETKTHLRDVLDHTQNVVEVLESHRESASSLMELCASLIAQRLNETMKVLTIIASIFIPLSFIAGVYGMNFDQSSPFNMPELSWKFGYPGVLALMLTVSATMLFAFRRVGWLGALAPDGDDEEEDDDQ